MRRAIVFAPLARLEFENAVAWYNDQRTGLGNEFQMDVNAALQLVLRYPEKFRLVSPSIRKIALKRFHKYGVYYSISPDTINVVSIFHASRNPTELHRRLK